MIWADLKSYAKNWRFVLLFLVQVILGIIGGAKAQFTLRESLAYNAPYQISFITAFLSLTTLLFSTVYAAQLALKEMDHRFNEVFFALPFSRRQFMWSRFLAVFLLTFFSTVVFTISFFLGREMANHGAISVPFSMLYYLLPLLFYTTVNSFFLVTLMCMVAWTTRNRLYIYVSGLLMYIFYMVALLFSGSPFMAGQLPQSEKARLLSAILDPFGISAFFYQSAALTIEQRNHEIFAASGILLVNRIAVMVLSFFLIWMAGRQFSFLKKGRRNRHFYKDIQTTAPAAFRFVQVTIGRGVDWKAFLSFVWLYIRYVTRSIPFLLLSLGILFAVGMEIYAEIEKGVRVPEKYATSGLMVSAIIQNYYALGVMIIVFYTNELFWRSRQVNFLAIEETTQSSGLNFWAIILVLSAIALYFTTLLILEGLIFQLVYDYPVIAWAVYARVYMFTALPLFLVGGLSLWIHTLVKHKYVSLAITAVLMLVMTSTLVKPLTKYPLFMFLQSVSFDYSDMNGFGVYEQAFSTRLFFGLGLVGFLLSLVYRRKRNWILPVTMFCLTIWLGTKAMDGYKHRDEKKAISQLVNYEKQFRRFYSIPQPIVVNIETRLDLYPKENQYIINGSYTLENKSGIPINEILINFSEDFDLQQVKFIFQDRQQEIREQFQVIKLSVPMLPQQRAKLEFTLSYRWLPVNGHKPLNAIVENGSFMRISRYYPQIGYQAGNELDDKAERVRRGLGAPTGPAPLDAPRKNEKDFLDLDMVISTDGDQTAIGVGELVKHWKEGSRAYFQYKASSIPFRFAVSSARYALKQENHHGRSIEIYYHPSHQENVAHLMANAKTTLDYCEENFGPYPFNTVRFAEVSGFTRGFNATAYPASIFMTEDMAFHCNIKADQQQDVINELAGHELAHMWWGNSQINPDDREGSVMLTETLAMYTELMLLKKMYGSKKMEQSVQIHQGIYDAEKGLSGDVPLVKALSDQTHIAYSKGAVKMAQLSNLIGERKVNEALSRFIQQYRYPHPRPISRDLLQLFYEVADPGLHEQIEALFEH